MVERASAAIRPVVGAFAAGLMLPIALGGCLPEQKNQLGACVSAAAQAYPAADLERNPMHLASYIHTCMAVHGYEWSPSHVDCPDFNGRIGANPYCYVPHNWLASAGYHVERRVRKLLGRG